MSSNTRIEWIDFCRGLAIIAVVVCHQQYTLHNSEIIQYLTLFSVTTLIFLAGLTKGMSLSRCSQKEDLSLPDLYLITLKKLIHIVLYYLFATLIVELFIYKVTNINDIISGIISFNALEPLYFIPIYLKLSLYSPLIFIVLKKLKSKHIYSCFFLLGLWLLAYYFEGKNSLFCGSYLFVYGLGMVVANTGMPSINKRNVGGGYINFINWNIFSWLLLLF